MEGGGGMGESDGKRPFTASNKSVDVCVTFHNLGVPGCSVLCAYSLERVLSLYKILINQY